MKKLCYDCQFRVSPIWDDSPPSAEYVELVEPAHCEKCAENKAAEIARREQADADWQNSKTDFVQNMGEIPRDSDWKQRLLDRLLPPN